MWASQPFASPVNVCPVPFAPTPFRQTTPYTSQMFSATTSPYTSMYPHPFPFNPSVSFGAFPTNQQVHAKPALLQPEAPPVDPRKNVQNGSPFTGVVIPSPLRFQHVGELRGVSKTNTDSAKTVIGNFQSAFRGAKPSTALETVAKEHIDEAMFRKKRRRQSLDVKDVDMESSTSSTSVSSWQSPQRSFIEMEDSTNQSASHLSRVVHMRPRVDKGSPAYERHDLLVRIRPRIEAAGRTVNNEPSPKHHKKSSIRLVKDHAGYEVVDSKPKSPAAALSSPKLLSCPNCLMEFSNKTKLKEHQCPDADRPFQCPHCDKRFRQKGTMITHVRIHTGEKPYCCRFCGANFRHRSTINRHVLKCGVNAVSSSVDSVRSSSPQSDLTE